MDNIEKKELSNICDRLADQVSSLANLTESVKDSASTYILRRMEPRLRQGLVRIAVVGIASSGKSTLVNALVNDLVLPENPSISSPIPVWLGYQPSEESEVEVFLSEDGTVKKEKCDALTFRKKYCYNVQDIMNKDRTRYNSVEFGTIKTNASILQGNVTLIDTLGISANTVDSRKTIRVLEEGVDAVIFVTKEKKINNLSEIPFLYRYVLGCREKGAEGNQSCNPNPIHPKNLIFVNNIFTGVPDKVEFSERIRELYRNCDLNLTEEEIEGYVQNNIYYVNAFQARMGRLGAYPYEQSAPYGSSEFEVKGLRDKEERERRKGEIMPPETMLQESGIQELEAAVQKLGYRLGYGKSEEVVSVKRIHDLQVVIDGIIDAANKRVAGQYGTIDELQKLMEHFQQQKADDAQEQEAIKEAMDNLSKDYRAAFTKLLAVITEDMKDVCRGTALLRPMPAGFNNYCEQYHTIKDKKTRQEYLAQLLPNEIQYIFDYCSGQMIQELDARQSEGFPFAVMAETREFMDKQATVLNARIEALRKSGGEELGMFFPKAIVVEELFKNLELDLDEKVKEIIADACITGGEKFEGTLQTIKKSNLNIFQQVVGLLAAGQKPKMFWSNIRKHVLSPLAESIVEKMPEHTVVSILEKTGKAFYTTKDAICDSHKELFWSLEHTLKQLEDQIASAGVQADDAKAQMQDLIKTCDEIKKDINQLGYELLQG